MFGFQGTIIRYLQQEIDYLGDRFFIFYQGYLKLKRFLWLAIAYVYALLIWKFPG